MAGRALDRAEFYEAHQEWPPSVKRSIAEHLLMAAPNAPRRCLFLGTATGINDAVPFATVADPDDQIIASDIDPDYLARLSKVVRQRGLNSVVPRRIDIQKDLGDLGTFDVVTLLFVIHRLDDWEPVVRELPALVSTSGSLYLSEFVGPSGVIYLSNEGAEAGPGFDFALDPALL